MTKGKSTPMMRQFLHFKEKYPDKILFFRMGDFYEMFGSDAEEAAPILGIALTSRSAGKEDPIPLCGVPYHAVDKYLPRLIEAGKKVVICEQVEDPKQARGIVKRDVVEIITPGTLTMESSLAPTQNSYLMAMCGDGKTLALAQLDLSTGDFSVVEDRPETILDIIQLARPRELLIPENDDKIELPGGITLNGGSGNVTPLEAIFFDRRIGGDNLRRFFDVSTLDGFGMRDMTHGVAAAGAILRYLQENKQERLQHITRITVGQSERRMKLDAATVRNLELFYNVSDGNERHSFFWAVNRTSSAMGARRLRKSLAAPFLEKEKIDYRLDAVAELFEDEQRSSELSVKLKSVPDLERLAGRVGLGKANPRTLIAIRNAVIIGGEVKEILKGAHAPMLKAVYSSIPELHELVIKISTAIIDEAPLAVNSGGIIRAGHSAELDDLNLSIKDARQFIATLAKSERERTGIPSLKVGFNKVFGYYIEVTRTHASKIPDDYIRKQTLVNAERFITEEMKLKEALILDAEEKINRLEEKLFHELSEQVAAELPAIMALADLIGEIDVVNGFAVLARQERYMRPQITEDRGLEIIQGRHPVISQILGPGKFVANDTVLDSEETSLVILTGPNMSGKSTWLRQTGLIVILAQAGSFVPAEKAEIGLVDRVFTRVGATDSLTRGQSTFLVEMVETANILNNQSERSLLLLDEIGRGTSTFDGLSVAWAVAESIYDYPGGTPRTLFATHYHEMTGLAGVHPRIKNYQVTVKKWGKEVVFLHQVVPGGCDDSYGIEVARLAGVPPETIRRAREILRLLESGKFAKSELAKGIHVRLNQTTLFDAAEKKASTEIEEKLKALDINNLTPLEALEFLSGLKKDLEDE